jgi:hypothetical protein
MQADCMGRLDKVESETWYLGIKMMIQNNKMNQVATILNPVEMARATKKQRKGMGLLTL